MTDRNAGAFYATIAYLAWGFVPLYWQPIRHVPALEILAHRVTWSAIFLAALILLRGRGGEVLAAVRDRKVLLRLALSTTLIATNWFVYIWSVTHGRVIEASLGYFVTPLVNVVLGLLVLSERLRRAQWAAVTLAALGVVWLVVGHGAVPWVTLVLAATFGSYGLVRKTARVDSLVGLMLETALLFPLSSAFLVERFATGSAAPATSVQMCFLFGAGAVTALPLLWFADAARRLPLTVLGFFQYLSPTVQFLLGLYWFKEPLGPAQLTAFVLIWAALLLFSGEAVYRTRHERSRST
ncbi:MAG: EamA family transporter RarD [Deltaproteobacteria bacterium]|nr:EamA family transporter RarD [Deltaproteobacteria bacterium]